MKIEHLPKEYQSCFRILDRSKLNFLESLYTENEKKSRDEFIFVIGNTTILFVTMQAHEEKTDKGELLDLMGLLFEWMHCLKSDYLQTVLQKFAGRQKSKSSSEFSE